MTQVNITQKSFAGGELSPELYVRTDISNYSISLGDSLNVLCTNKGDLIPRPGTEFVGLTAGVESDAAPNRARLIPFKFSETESYILEFTERKLRIYKDGKPLSYTTGGSTYESIESAQYLHEMQYPVVGGDYASESGQFVFAGEGGFPYEAGAGPFTISDVQGNTISNLSYMHGSALADTDPRSIANNNVFWVHSVERGVEGKAGVQKADNANNIIGKKVDIVRITWHPKFAEGGSAYNATNFLIADSTTSRPADSAFPATKWTFFTATIKSSVTTFNELLDTGDIEYRNFFGPTDTAAGGEATSPIPYLQSELFDLQYATAGDLMFITHPNHQPIKIERVGLESFKVHYHHTIGGPWRPYPTYPNTYWGGTFFMTGSTTTVLPGDGGNGPTPTSSDIRDVSDATDVIYLWKSKGTPDIITNSDLSSTEADDAIVGRKIRICLPVGHSIFSNGDTKISSSNLNSWNTSFINTRDIVSYSASGGEVNSGTKAVPPRAIGNIISKDSIDSPVFFWMEAEVEALVNTSGSIKHKNPTSGYRIRITKGANLLQTAISSRYFGPCARTKIGRLFENVQPDGTGGWPACVAIVDNRLVYAATQEAQNALAFSSAGNFDDFTPDDYGYNIADTIDADNLNNWSVAGTYNPETFDYHSFVHILQEGLADKIQWLKATNYGLIAGTENGIYLSPKLPSGQAYTPFNFTMRLISEEGCNNVQAEYIDGKIYYINKLGDKLLSMEYVNEADGFRPKVESILSEHLIKDGVKAITYARTPINVIWLVTNNGSLVSGVRLDTNREKAFFKHKIASADFNKKSNSLIDSVAVVPSDDQSFDQLYVSVRRQITFNGLNAGSYAEPTGTSGIDGKEANSIERLTQYSPFLNDSRDFVGLDCSVNHTTHYDGNQSATASYKGVTEISSILNFNDSTAPATNELKITTTENHGLSADDDFMLNAVKGELSFLNLSTLHNATVAATTNLETTPVESPDVYLTGHGYSAGTLISNAHLLTKQDAYLPGRLKEDGTNYNLLFKYFPIVNNYSVFKNGLLELSVFSLGEKGDPDSYTEWSSNTYGFYKSSVYPHRVFYTRQTTSSTFATSAASGNPTDHFLTGKELYHYVAGFKPDIYFTTLPTRVNNQYGDSAPFARVGNADLSYAFISSVSAQVMDTHQIKVRNSQVDAYEVDLIDDPYTSTVNQPLDVARRSGTYKQELVQPEENTRGQVRFEPEPGYPFRVLEINLRGERSSRG